MKIKAWCSWGKTRGLGPRRLSRIDASADVTKDAAMLGGLGGRTDRAVYAIDADGYLRDDAEGYVYNPARQFALNQYTNTAEPSDGLPLTHGAIKA